MAVGWARGLRLRAALVGYLARRLAPPIAAVVAYIALATLVVRWDEARGGVALPSLSASAYGVFTQLFFECTEGYPPTTVARVVFWLTPVVGGFLVAEGLFKVGASLFDIATRREVWLSIVTSQLRGHVVVCGLGHVGYRVVEELRSLGVDGVGIEQEEKGGFVDLVRAMDVPVFIGDARRDDLLEKAGVARAQAVVCATADDLANLEVALDSMLPEVRSAWHGTLADALVARFGAQAEAHPESLARHYAEAGRPLEAATWAERASRQAFARSAPVEAVRLLRFASGELSGVPASDRRGDLEIGVQRGLVSALVATRGMASPDTEAALSRMHALHVARGEAAHAFLVARMIGTQAASRAEYGRALADADRALADPICATSPRLVALARAQRGMALFAGARFVEARADLDRSIALFDWLPPAGPVAVDPRLFAGGFAARVLWHLGMPDRAVARADDGLRIARAMGFAHAEILAQSALAFVHYERRDPCATERALEGLEARAGARALPSLVGLVAVGRAWVEAQRGEDRTASTSEAIARYCDNGIRFELSQLHAIAADACLAVGQVDRGLSFVADGLAFAAQSGELHAEPELYRLRAALVDQARGVGSEEARDALEIAASLAAVSGARSLALRIACDLARWHLAQGDGAAARDALAPELALIVEGEGTIDVLDARSLAGLLAADVA